MLYLSQLLIVPGQPFLVSAITSYLGCGTPVVKLMNSIIDFGPEVVTLLEELELSQCVGLKGPS